MAKFSNMYGIKSKSILDALTADDYDLSDKPGNVYSCTEIIDAPKVKVLTRRHDAEITRDVSDNFWTFDGSAVHYAVEMANKKTKAARLSEERIFIQITAKGEFVGHTMPKGARIVDQPWYNTQDLYVSAKYDNYEYDDATIEDYKRTSVWEAVNGLKESRVQQLNINCLAMRLIGFPVQKLRAVLLLKDWTTKELKSQESKCRGNGWTMTYPLIPYKEFEAEIWDDAETKKYILDRLNLHVTAKNMTDDEIPECLPEERWYRGESFAIMKKGNKVATKVFKVEDFSGSETMSAREEAMTAAEQYLADCRTKKPKDTFEIEVRPGNDARCNGDITYCHCKQFCSYWKRTYASEMVGVDSEY